MGADIPLNLLWALVKGPTIQYSFQHHFPRLALTLSSFVWNRKQPSLSFPYKLYSFRFFFFFSNLTCGRSSTPTVVWLTPKRTNLSPRAIIYEILFSRRVLISHQYQQQQQQVVQRALDSSLSLSLSLSLSSISSFFFWKGDAIWASFYFPFQRVADEWMDWYEMWTSFIVSILSDHWPSFWYCFFNLIINQNKKIKTR